MRLLVYLFSLLFCLTVAACQNQSEAAKADSVQDSTLKKLEVATPEPLPSDFEKGKIIKSIFVANSTNNASYALRLPLNFDAKKPAPLLVFFDSHGKGAATIKQYANLSDEFGLIFVASNTSKNGQDFGESNRIYEELMADLNRRFSIDPHRIWLTGFSGGARVAASLAQNHPDIAGVLGCAAGFQAQSSDRFDYLGFVGMEDFNYLEMRHLSNILDHNSMRHALIFFDGGHKWPSPSDFRRGLEFITIRNMTKNPVFRNDSLIKVFSEEIEKDKKSNIAQKNAEWQLQLQQLKVSALSDLIDLSAEKRQLDEKKVQSEQEARMALLQKEEQQEMALRDEYVPKITGNEAKDWLKFAGILQQKANGKDQNEAWLYRRLLNFLSLNTYFQLSGALQQGNLSAAQNFQKIYALVDPKNSEHAYLLAVIYARQIKNAEAIQSLQFAEKLGFNDLERLNAETHFDRIRNEEAFLQIIKRIEASE